MFTDHLRVENPGGATLQVWIEPSGMVLDLPPSRSFLVCARSAMPGHIVASSDDAGVTVWVWEGATLEVLDGQRVVYQTVSPVPGTPAGMSSRDFLELTGLSKVR